MSFLNRFLNRDKDWENYCSDKNMFSRLDKEEFDHIKNRAQEIASGESSGLFERDEKVWKEINKLLDE